MGDCNKKLLENVGVNAILHTCNIMQCFPWMTFLWEYHFDTLALNV